MDRNETASRVLYGATIVVAADQLTKTAVSSLSDTHPAWLLPLRNHGLSFQLVTAGRWAEVALMAAVLALSAWPLIRTAQSRRAPSWAVALILGGAVGNLLDRMLFSAVRDFLPLGHLVVINVADVAIITGLATTGFTLYATRRRPGARVPVGWTTGRLRARPHKGLPVDVGTGPFRAPADTLALNPGRSRA
jgi:signal peptidase II